MGHFRPLPTAPCQQCGEPLSAREGQTMIATTTVTYDEHGQVVAAEPNESWCGRCVAEWNERMGAQ